MIQIPTTSEVLRTLFRADMTTQWRNRRASILVLLVPVIILFTAKRSVNNETAHFILAMCITIGITASCLMGYANSLARDRDKGVFQRLRVSPAPTWAILTSRLLVQLVVILFVVIASFLFAYYVDHIQLTPLAYAATILTSLVGALVFLSLGQMIVALIKNPETINSTTRLVYLVFIFVGLMGDTGQLGPQVVPYVTWTPYGTVRRVLTAGMHSGAWNADTTTAFLVSLAYAAVFVAVGVRRFQWSSR
jgi:ABC-2 type transport system permease protein